MDEELNITIPPHLMTAEEQAATAAQSEAIREATTEPAEEPEKDITTKPEGEAEITEEPAKAEEPVPFFKRKDVLGKEFENEDEFFNTFKELSAKANAEPAPAPEPKYPTAFHKYVADKAASSDFEGKTPQEITRAIAAELNEFSTDWVDTAKNDPLAVIIEQTVRESDGTISKEVATKMVQRQYKAPDEDDFEPEEYATELAIHDGILRRDANKAAQELNSKRPQIDFTPDTGKAEAEKAQLDAYVATGTKLLDEGFSIPMGESGDYVVVTSKDGKRTPEGEAVLAALNDPAGAARKLLFNESGGYDPQAIARLTYLAANLPKIVEKRAQEIAGKGKADELKDKRNADGSPINPASGDKTADELFMERYMNSPAAR